MARTGSEGINLFEGHHPDVVILDLGLPDQSGHDVLKQLRLVSDVPVIILTVNNTDKEKEALLDLGADDYLTKPFSLTELMARVRVALRHGAHLKDSSVYHNGPLTVDFQTRDVTINSVNVKLTPTEFDLLKTLIKYAGRILTQTQLLREVWGPYAEQQSHYVRIYVGQLRRKLEKNTGITGLITTEQGVGYRLSIYEV
jgi:two-component system KDP operon response regulator KdpE